MSYQLELCSASLFTLLCVFLSLLYRNIRRKYSYFKSRDIPGPEPLILVGSWGGIWSKFLGTEDIARSKVFGRVYGTYDGFKPNLMVIEPNIIRHLLTESRFKFESIWVKSTSSDPLRAGLSFLRGEGNMHIQNLFEGPMPNDKLIQLMPRVEASVQALVQSVPKQLEGGDGTVRFTTLVSELVRDVTALVVFGIDLNADVDFKQEFVGFHRQLLDAKNPDSPLAAIPFLYENFAGENWVIPKKALHFFTSLVHSSVRETPRNAVFVEGKAVDLIKLLVQASEEEKLAIKRGKGRDSEDEYDDEVTQVPILTESIMTAKCIATILAFASCAKTTLLMAIHSLATHPEVEARLHKEILAQATSDVSSFEQLQAVPYLDMVFSEVLRYYPYEFRVEKICREALTVDKYSIEVGTQVSVPLYALHHSEEFYTNPEKFDPDRFDQESSLKRLPNTYLPFGHGGAKASDISLQLSMLTAKLALYKLVQKYKFTKAEKWNQELFKVGFTGIPVPQEIQVMAELRN